MQSTRVEVPFEHMQHILLSSRFVEPKLNIGNNNESDEISKGTQSLSLDVAWYTL